MKNNRNNQRVGKNSASYNDKHPHNPVQLKPIRAAKKRHPIRAKQLEKLGALPRPALATAIRWVKGHGDADYYAIRSAA